MNLLKTVLNDFFPAWLTNWSERKYAVRNSLIITGIFLLLSAIILIMDMNLVSYIMCSFAICFTYGFTKKEAKVLKKISAGIPYGIVGIIFLAIIIFLDRFFLGLISFEKVADTFSLLEDLALVGISIILTGIIIVASSNVSNAEKIQLRKNMFRF